MILDKRDIVLKFQECESVVSDFKEAMPPRHSRADAYYELIVLLRVCIQTVQSQSDHIPVW